MYDVIIIGGGPTGMMAALQAALRGLRVLLLEKNEKLGKKLYITGKGRCNITNACELSDFFSNITKNPKFMMSALHRFSNWDFIDFLEQNGLPVKIERGERVFPASDKASDVIKLLERLLDAAHVRVQPNTAVTGVKKENNIFEVQTDVDALECRALIVTTGGKSYPATGSTGDGYRFAQDFGHKTTPVHPALVPLEDEHNICAKMQGLTLKNVGFSLAQQEKTVYSAQGELLFTHFGLSGPLALSASSYIDYTKDLTSLYGRIDLKPALDAQTLDARLLRDFREHHKKQLKTYMNELLPSKMIDVFLSETGLDAQKQLSQVTRAERTALIAGLKCFQVKIGGPRPFEEAVITAGGVDVKGINPSTMESTLVENLHFAGEVLDVSAQTGGFNLQIAFSTGYAAGVSVLQEAATK